MKLSRIGRWVVPGAALSLAFAAIGSLIAWELADGGAPAPRTPLLASAQLDPRPRAAQRSSPPPPARQAARPTSPAAPRRPGPRGEPAPAPSTFVPPPPAAIERRVSPVRETPAGRRATPHLARLVKADSLRARLDIVQGLAQELEPALAADALTGLLDCELPGEFYEAQTLRLGLLAALGGLPAAQARDALAERLAVTWPRQERIMAIEMLATRSDARRDDLLALAERDPDTHVRAKARWALQRRP